MTSCFFVNFKQLNAPWDGRNIEKKFFWKIIFPRRLKMHVTKNKCMLTKNSPENTCGGIIFSVNLQV